MAESHLDIVCFSKTRFPFGELVATPNALSSISNDEILRALGRHSQGDWGDLGRDDWATNDRALEHGGRLFSAYNSAHGTRFWIVTEHDRSVTTVLLPEDY